MSDKKFINYMWEKQKFVFIYIILILIIVVPYFTGIPEKYWDLIYYLLVIGLWVFGTFMIIKSVWEGWKNYKESD